MSISNVGPHQPIPSDVNDKAKLNHLQSYFQSIDVDNYIRNDDKAALFSLGEILLQFVPDNCSDYSLLTDMTRYIGSDYPIKPDYSSIFQKSIDLAVSSCAGNKPPTQGQLSQICLCALSYNAPKSAYLLVIKFFTEGTPNQISASDLSSLQNDLSVIESDKESSQTYKEATRNAFFTISFMFQ